MEFTLIDRSVRRLEGDELKLKGKVTFYTSLAGNFVRSLIEADRRKGAAAEGSQWDNSNVLGGVGIRNAVALGGSYAKQTYFSFTEGK